MEELRYLDRRNTNSAKWDDHMGLFGEEGLHGMWVADMDFKVPGCVQKALADYVEQGVFGYYATPDSYFESIINWEKKRHGFDVKREWIRFSPGVVAAFHWAVKMFTEPGDAVIVQTPVYYPFFKAAESNNRELITSDLVNEGGIYTVDFGKFEQDIIDNDVRLFILCSPHNPAGRVWKREELEKMFEICRKHEVFVVADEIHQDLVYADNVHCSVGTIPGYEDMRVVITAPSKTFNLAAGQNSVVIIENEENRKLWDEFVDSISIRNGNAFGYVAAEAAYKGGEEWLDAIRKQVYENHLYVKEYLAEKLPEAILTPLEGTYLTWIDLSAYGTMDEIHEWIIKRAKLAVDFGDWFGGERFGGFIRMNLATNHENVEEGLRRIVEAK